MNTKLITALLVGAIALTVVSGCSEANTGISLSDTFSVAERYLSEMKYEQAIIEFDKILSVEPKNAEAYVGKAEANIGLENYSEAADVLNTCLKTAENIDYVALIDIAEKILAADSMVIDAYMVIADAFITLGEVEKAINTLKKGYEQTGDERIKTRFDNLTSSITVNTNEVGNTVAEMSTEEITTDAENNDKKDDFVDNMIEIAGNMYSVDITELDLYRKGLCDDDIKNISKLSKLKTLNISYNNLTDISPLCGLINLERLESYANDIIDISPLKELKNLKYLNLEANNITDLSSLNELTNLEYICLSGNNITDISPLSGLVNVKELHLSGNNITDISPLSELVNLEITTLHENNIAKIPSLNKLTRLKYITIYRNNVSDYINDMKHFRAAHPECTIP